MKETKNYVGRLNIFCKLYFYQHVKFKQYYILLLTGGEKLKNSFLPLEENCFNSKL